MMSAVLSLALLMGPIPTLPPGVSLPELIAFASPAATEDVWVRHAEAGCGELYRVIYSAYAASPEAVELVVWWEGRGIPKMAFCKDVGEAATVQAGIHGKQVAASSTPPNRGPQAEKAWTETVRRAYFRLPADTQVEDLWWTLPASNSFERMHLRPHKVAPKDLFTARSPTYDMRQADADSEAPVTLSLLRSDSPSTCGWYREEAGNPNSRKKLATSHAACATTRVSISPSAKMALLSGGGFQEVDLQSGQVRSLPVPEKVEDQAHFATAGYDADGVLWAVLAKSVYVAGLKQLPATVTTYRWEKKRWKKQTEKQEPAWPRDAFPGRRSPLTRQLNCQVLHKGNFNAAPLGTGICDLDRDACNSPAWLPLSPEQEAQVGPLRLEPSKQRRMQLPTNHGALVATFFSPVGGDPELNGPYIWVPPQGPAKTLSTAHSLRLAMRGPYLLMTDAERAGQPAAARHTLWDVRSQKTLETLDSSTSYVAFWPLAQ